MSWFRLQLPASQALPRDLGMRVSPGFGLSVWMSVPDIGQIAYASAPISNCRLDKASRGWALWIGSAAFNLTAAEADRVLDVFAPDGLKIASAFPSSAAAEDPAAAHEAAAADSPGTRGMSSATELVGADTLGSIQEVC